MAADAASLLVPGLGAVSATLLTDALLLDRLSMPFNIARRLRFINIVADS